MKIFSQIMKLFHTNSSGSIYELNGDESQCHQFAMYRELCHNRNTQFSYLNVCVIKSNRDRERVFGGGLGEVELIQWV